MPGGRLELKETLIESAKRELKEETGLDAEQLTYIGVVRDLQESYNFIHFAYFCTSYSGTLETTEPEKCEGWEWHSLSSLPQDILPGHLAAINLYKYPENGSLYELL